MFLEELKEKAEKINLKIAENIREIEGESDDIWTIIHITYIDHQGLTKSIALATTQPNTLISLAEEIASHNQWEIIEINTFAKILIL